MLRDDRKFLTSITHTSGRLSKFALWLPDFQKDIQKDLQNYFLNPKVPKSQSTKVPSYQGPKVLESQATKVLRCQGPRLQAPMRQHSKALKPFYSSQNPLNSSFTLKQLLLITTYWQKIHATFPAKVPCTCPIQFYLTLVKLNLKTWRVESEKTCSKSPE